MQAGLGLEEDEGVCSGAGGVRECVGVGERGGGGGAEDVEDGDDGRGEGVPPDWLCASSASLLAFSFALAAAAGAESHDLAVGHGLDVGVVGSAVVRGLEGVVLVVGPVGGEGECLDGWAWVGRGGGAGVDEDCVVWIGGLGSCVDARRRTTHLYDR